MVTRRSPCSPVLILTDCGEPIACTTSHSVMSRPTLPRTGGPGGGTAAPGVATSDESEASAGWGAAGGAGATGAAVTVVGPAAHAPCPSTRSPGATGWLARAEA